jgi:uncharacterized membrane protein YoaK (UPF0700 family)
MSRDELGQLALAVGLTALAGYVDAIGLLRLGNLFVSFMSGDSTQLAVAVSQARWMKAGEAAAIVLLFVLGVSLGRLVGVAAKAWRRPAVLASETALLILAAALGPATRLAFVPLVMAMGMQNAAVRQVGQSRAGLTYVTGALVSVGEKLADAFSARTPEARLPIARSASTRSLRSRLQLLYLQSSLHGRRCAKSSRDPLNVNNSTLARRV